MIVVGVKPDIAGFSGGICCCCCCIIVTATVTRLLYKNYYHVRLLKENILNLEAMSKTFASLCVYYFLKFPFLLV